MPRAVLLDIDGTLVDSNDLHAEAWCEAVAAQGKVCDFAEVRRMVGMGGDKIVPALMGVAHDSVQGTSLSERRVRIFVEQKLAHVHPFPGARELLEALIERGFRLCTATSAKRDELRGILARGGVADLLPARTSADDAEQSKPEPDIVRAALALVECEARDAIMLGDTPYDAEAALRAGVRFVGLTCGGHDEREFIGASAVYRDPSELLARLADSPFARS